MKNFIYWGFFLIIFCSLGQAADGVRDEYIIAKKFPERLSDFQFFQGMSSHLPAENVIPYELISSLFSDYTLKERFIYIPDKLVARYSKDSTYEFPVGSALIKTFYYKKDERNAGTEVQLLETRLLLKKFTGWDAASYVWNDDQDEALLRVAGATINTSWIDQSGKQMSVRYRVPNKNQCQECHESNNDIKPIGPKVINLNKNIRHPVSSEAVNQLDYWLESGMIYHYPETMESVVNWKDENNDLDARARSYLAINCGHCHIATGNGASSGLYLNFAENRPKQLGIYKKPVAAGRGSGGNLYSIMPGKADESILLYRMRSIDPGIMMPESGRSLIHEEGVHLIQQWIEEM